MKFYLDFFGEDQTIDGISQGSHWNGWECPYFTFENAMKLKDLFGKNGFLKYNKKKDVFIFDSKNDDREEFEPVFIDGIKYYAIGAFSWCWNREDETEEE